MEPKDPHSAKSNEERRTSAKVVQFPREWFGPTDDLVPFGASEHDAAPPSSSPPSAQSFWTEDAASLHDALQGSPPPGAPPPPEASPQPPPSRRMPQPLCRPSVRGRKRPTLAVGGIALALVVLILSLLGSTHRPVATHRPSARARSAPLTADIGPAAPDWRHLARVNSDPERAATRRSVAPTKPAGARRLRRPRQHSKPSSAPSSADKVVVTYRATTTTPPPAAAAEAQTPVTPAAPVARHATPSTADTAANPNPASLLGPGHCACG